MLALRLLESSLSLVVTIRSELQREQLLFVRFRAERNEETTREKENYSKIKKTG